MPASGVSILKPVRDRRGQTLINAMIAIALIGLLALFSSSAVNYITHALGRNDRMSRLMELDMDVANLLAIPQECSCNFMRDASGNPISFANDSATFSLQKLQFFMDPPTCNGAKADSVVTVGQLHAASGLRVTGIQLGPFHPLGRSGTYLADLTVSAEGLQQPYQSKVLLSTTANGGQHAVKFCGMNLGSAPNKAPDDSTPAAGLDGFYRYSQMSLNFACPNLPNGTNLHPIQTEPYVFTRVQYFWPRQEGDFLTDYETARTAGTVMAPVSFSAFYGTDVCYEVDGQGDAIRVIVPSYNAKNCGKVKKEFLAGATVVDVGFSVIDNCRSRFF